MSPAIWQHMKWRRQRSLSTRHVYAYQLRNIEDGTVILYSSRRSSLWFDELKNAADWLSSQENKRLDPDNIKRPLTKWKIVSFFSVDEKVVLDRQPLLGTGPLPNWLRNLAHSRSMVALDTYRDNLCLPDVRGPIVAR